MRKVIVKIVLIFSFLSLALASLPQSPFTIPEVKATPDSVTLDAVWSKEQSPSVWINETTGANNSTANDMTLPPMNSGTPGGDAYYLGCTTQIFDTVKINVTTAGAWTSGTIRLEYSTGTTTFAYMDTTNYASYFTSTGVKTWTFTPPDNWLLRTVNGVSAYWIRLRVTALSEFSTAPKGGQAWLSYRVTYTLDGGAITISNTGDVSTVNWNSLRIMDDANAWGIFGYMASADSVKDYVLRGGIIIENNITFVPAISPLNYKITMQNSFSPLYYIQVNTGGTCNFGRLESESAKTVSMGTQISILSTTVATSSFVILNNGGNLNFYGSSVSSPTCRIQSVAGSTTRVWGAVVSQTAFEGEGYDFYNVIFNGGIPFQSINYDFSASIDRVTMNKPSYVYFLSYMVTTSTVFNNLYSRGHSYVIYYSWLSEYAIDVDFINPDFDTWAFYLGSYTGEVYRKYSFDLTVTFPNGTAIQNANVTITYSGQGGGTAYSGTTDSNGKIPTQTLTMGFYNRTGGNTIYNYNPYTLTITSSYGNYSKEWNLDAKTNWEIAVTPTTPLVPTSSKLSMGFILGFVLAGCVGLIFGLTLSGSKRR
jgi:hypothetical protein